MAYNVHHLKIAHETIPLLGKLLSKESLGYYYLGSVFPDASAIEQYLNPQSNRFLKRNQYHFFHQSPDTTDDLFLAPKSLPKDLPWNINNPDERAFYLGILNHLNTDALYNLLIVRKYILNGGIFSTPTHHNLIRYLIDQSCLEYQSNQTILDTLATVDINKLVKFYPQKVIEMWREIVIKQLNSVNDYSTYFHAFVGFEDICHQSILQYPVLMPQIKKYITSELIEDMNKKIHALNNIVKNESFDPHSIITINDLTL